MPKGRQSAEDLILAYDTFSLTSLLTSNFMMICISELKMILNTCSFIKDLDYGYFLIRDRFNGAQEIPDPKARN